jgi:hypothetical protein
MQRAEVPINENYKFIIISNIMKRSYLTKAFVSLFTVVALCSCSKDEDPDSADTKSADCEILSFSVNGVNWDVSGTNITHTYPAGTAETSLAPAITLSAGASVNPATDVAQNFFTTQGVTYIVTAEDGITKKTYTARASVEPGNNGGNGVIQNNTITVAVENGASYNSKIDLVRAVIYTDDKRESTLTSAPYANGGFTLNLPASVSAQYLDGLDEIPEGLTVSNPGVKMNQVDLEAYKSDSIYEGDFYHRIGNWEGTLIYVDGDLSITGTYTETYNEGTENEYTHTEKYNSCSLNRGWNMMYVKETKVNSSYEYEWTTQAPEGAKWYFEDYSSFSVSGSLQKQVHLLSVKHKQD